MTEAQLSLADPEPELDLRGLSVPLPERADRWHTIERMSLIVRPQEILYVVGQSGSSKSVTAHSVMGLLPRGQRRPVAVEGIAHTGAAG